MSVHYQVSSVLDIVLCRKSVCGSHRESQPTSPTPLNLLGSKSSLTSLDSIIMVTSDFEVGLYLHQKDVQNTSEAV